MKYVQTFIRVNTFEETKLSPLNPYQTDKSVGYLHHLTTTASKLLIFFIY